MRSSGHFLAMDKVVFLANSTLFALRRRAKALRRKHLQWTATIVASVFGLFLLAFFVPNNIRLSFAGESCSLNPMLLPRLSKHQSSSSFEPVPADTLDIAGYPIFSTKTCINTKAAPVAGQTERPRISLLHIPFLSKNINIATPPFASIEPDFDTSQAVGTETVLSFKLGENDTLFDYQIKINDQAESCIVDGSSVACPLKPFALDPGSQYAVDVGRYFAKEHAETIFDEQLTTLDPVIFTESSIKADATIYNAPTELVLTANKDLSDIGEIKLNDATVQDAEIKDDRKLHIPLGELERKKAYKVSITGTTSKDMSNLIGEYAINFITSGGPKVASINIGSSRVSTGSRVVLTFDVALKADQKLPARIEIGGKAVAASVTASGNKITINPTGYLPRCSSFKVVVDAGLINEHGIGNGEAYSKNSRTLCGLAFSIGRSVQGRSISGWRFGTGASKIVFVGGMHGNERSSVATMNAFVTYLEDHFDQIPANRSIYIIPNSNPDGYARNSRTNANGVDLNRNFPANDWQASVEMPGGITAPTGGGNSAGDQPETQALMSFINANHPRLVLTYHAVARVVISNDAGDSVARGQEYANTSGYRFTTDAGSDDEFGYATTGEFEDWLADKKGIPGILIEQAYMRSNEFTTHRSALMKMVRLP